MRTTLDVEEDVLLAAKEIAKQRRDTVGRVLSDLAGQALTRRDPLSKKHGVPLFPVRKDAGVITLELVNATGFASSEFIEKKGALYYFA